MMPSQTPDTRTSFTDISSLRVLVVGLGRFGGGVGVTRWLIHEGAQVTVTDVASADTLQDSISRLADVDVTFHLGGHDLEDLCQADLVVINPAVIKSRSEIFKEITKRDILWTTEMNLFCERCAARVIGVTGSYGKSTTCAMLDHVMRSCLERDDVTYTGVHLGGNIGRSLLMDLPRIKPTDLVVLEMSNAQLEDLPRIDWAPEIAVITNLKPHHLERYEGFESYIHAKLNILGSNSTSKQLIVGDCDPLAIKMIAECANEMSIPIVEIKVDEIKASSSRLTLQVPGIHNQQNASAVLAIAQTLNLNESLVRESLQTFRGLPHRMEFVLQVDGVDYINDSKSTSPAAIVSALQSLQKPLVVIVGGQRKEKVSFEECAHALISSAGAVIRAVICTGQTGPQWHQVLRHTINASGETKIPVLHQADDLEEAVRLAKKEARTGDTVLFTPGAPSFDAYHNFALRGEHFASIVRK